MRFVQVRHWKPEEIIQHIMARNGVEPLNSYYYATKYPSVYAAATRLFGSWEDTITACGLDYNLIRKYKRWSKTAVINQIRKLHQENQPISSQAVQNNHKSLYMAAIKRFRCWRRAVEAAGIDYRQIKLRRNLNETEIRRLISELPQRQVNLSYTSMRRDYQYLLAAASKKIGDGSWACARLRCGIMTNYRLKKPHTEDGKKRS